MGYHHVALKFKCGKCGKSLIWKSADGSLPNSRAAVCPCGAVNHVSLPDRWAKVPQYLWLGPDKHTRFKLYATPPEHGNEPWALPYSIRSFVAQASAAYPGCRFQTSARGEVMGETVFEDTCAHVVEADGRDEGEGQGDTTELRGCVRLTLNGSSCTNICGTRGTANSPCSFLKLGWELPTGADRIS